MIFNAPAARRTFIASAATTIFLLLACLPPKAWSADASPSPPNVLFIMVDDLNDWVGPLAGHPQAWTPNLDRLARRGMVFANAHAAAPLCGPTRTALLSGLPPAATGIYGHHAVRDAERNPAIQRTTWLPKYFAKHGYQTLSCGKIFHEGSPPAQFDVVGGARSDYGPRPKQRMAYHNPGTSTDWGPFPERDDQMPDMRTARWAVQQLRARHDRPFLLCVGFVRPHVPWHVPPKWFDRHPLAQITRPPYRPDDLDDLPETARRFSQLPMMPTVEWMQQEQRWEKSVQAYLASVTFVDDCIGQVLDALAASEYAQNTIVVVVGDHGYQLGEKGIWAKHTLWERATRVPLLIARPDDSDARRTSQPVNHLDLYPTLVELAGLPPNRHNQGRSLAPLLDDPDADGFSASVTTHGYGNHVVRSARWRYIRYADGAEELYDHQTDPHEWRNLAAAAEYSSVLAELRRELPRTDAPWMPGTQGGMEYNDFLKECYRRSRAGD